MRPTARSLAFHRNPGAALPYQDSHYSTFARPSALGLALLFAIMPIGAMAQSATLRVQNVALIAASCANCHGVDGRGSADIPALRGSSAAHLKQRMLDFQQGKASDATVMTRLMRGYTAPEINALADWFAAPANKTEKTEALK